VDDDDLHSLLREIPGMIQNSKGETADLLEELQKAAEEHRKILERQSDLIRRLREELKDVR
jgi:uncharacterized coiled-coil protein SlyX